MYRPGDVVLVESDQAAGYATRDKYHVCVCGYRGRYLFINSNPWRGSFAITHQQFPELPKTVSHIACNTLLEVSDQYMVRKNAKTIGRLSDEIIEKLMDHINECDVMTEEEKEIAVNGLASVL